MQQLANLCLSWIPVVCPVFVAGEARVQTVQTKQSIRSLQTSFLFLSPSLSLSTHSLPPLSTRQPFIPTLRHGRSHRREPHGLRMADQSAWRCHFALLPAQRPPRQPAQAYAICPLSAPSPLTVQALTMSSTRPKRNNLPLSASPIPSPSSSPNRDRRTLHQPRRPSLASLLS